MVCLGYFGINADSIRWVLPIRSNDHMAALGVFGLLQLVAFGDYVKSKVPTKQFKSFLIVSIVLVVGLGIGGLFGLTAMGWIAPWTGRFYSLWDTNYAKIHIQLLLLFLNINLLLGQHSFRY